MIIDQALEGVDAVRDAVMKEADACRSGDGSGIAAEKDVGDVTGNEAALAIEHLPKLEAGIEHGETVGCCDGGHVSISAFFDSIDAEHRVVLEMFWLRAAAEVNYIQTAIEVTDPQASALVGMERSDMTVGKGALGSRSNAIAGAGLEDQRRSNSKNVAADICKRHNRVAMFDRSALVIERNRQRPLVRGADPKRSGVCRKGLSEHAVCKMPC